ncbi:hypothetical protein EWM64_g7973 [Hericium alpestre]|uniref:Uncharacterized protein n=1 Tax=Hericium alpestre TaxID=135208 RepID=A0A4Y9ZP55_9AGAM|nr:hypothetical protein EWM64_g7973 [Hericium alpestre]
MWRLRGHGQDLPTDCGHWGYFQTIFRSLFVWICYLFPIRSYHPEYLDFSWPYHP